MRLQAVAAGYGLTRMCGCAVRKGRTPTVDTRVARYVAKHAPPLQRRLARALRAHARTIAPAIAKRYRAATKGMDDIIRRVLAAADAEGLAGELEGQLAYALRQAFKRQAVAGIEAVGIAITREAVAHMDEAALEYAATRGGQLIKDLAGTTIDDLRRLLGRAIREAMSPDELEQQVLDLGAFGPARAEMIARTELAFAHVQGNVRGWRESGLVVAKRWLLGDRHEIDDECDDAVDAGAVPLDDEFVEGIAFPPAHPNCICDVEPILRESGGAATED